ncbi:MAG: FAD-dependent oxidoreductase [Persicimonas sp.]
MDDTRIAIVGAGPIGLEAALYASERGYQVDVYERATPGANVARWSHVRLFSPWAMNRSGWAERRLREEGVSLADEGDYPTGGEFRREYLLRLARLEDLADSIHTHTNVVGVSRRHAFKSDFIGDERRDAEPFVLLVDSEDGRRYVEADVVIDTTGVYDQPRRLGPGGLPAIGEERAELVIERYIPDALGEERALYEDATTLLIGGGYSAVTSAWLLHELRADAPDTDVLWLLTDGAPPYPPIEDDPLPARLELARFGNEAARGAVDGIEPVFGQLHRLEPTERGVAADIDTDDGLSTRQADRVVANVGYRPDTALYRELQVHLCYATEGLMDLSAHLLSQGAEAAGDCLAQTSGGFDTLVSPEPNFFVLGSKSYGRHSDFLLQRGFEQIETLFSHLQP